MDSSARSGATGSSNPRAWIVAGVAVAGVIVLAEVARRRRRWLRGKSSPPPYSGAFCDRLELAPPPQPPPPAARQQLSDLTFAVSDNFEIEGYVAGFGNPDWKRTHKAASHTAVAVKTLLKQGATCVGRTVMDELGFGVTGENLHCGTPINPASPSVVPGGSCSGSAVAVSAQLVDFALGTDTTGDLRIPASFCGVLGFRSSHGVVSTLGTLANSHSLDTIGWLARDPHILNRVGDALLPVAACGLKGKRQLVFADDCFELLKIPNQKTVDVIENAVHTLPGGYQPPKHINIGQYISSNVPSLKEFCEPSTKFQEGKSALKALCTVMLLLQRYEFKSNHEDWVNTVKPKLGLEVSTRVLQAVNFTDDNVKSLYIVRTEWRAALRNLLKDTGILVLPTMAGHPLKRNSKQRLSSEFEDKMYAFVSIAALSGCCQATVPLGNHNDHPISISFVAAHGSDKFLLRAILDMYSTIQEQIVLASKLALPPVIDRDVDASELLKEKGNNSFKRKQWSKAIEFYSGAIKLNDTNATYYCNRAAAYLKLGRFKQAEADCDQALLLDKKNVKAYLRRGTAKESCLNYQEALQDFRHALALEPQNKTALAAERRLQKHLSRERSTPDRRFTPVGRSKLHRRVARRRPPVCPLLPLRVSKRLDKQANAFVPCTPIDHLVWSSFFLRDRSNGDAAAAAPAPAPDADGPARVPHRELPLGLLAVAIVHRAGRHHHLHDTPPAAPRRRGARAVRAPPARAARHAGLHLPLLRVPLRALAPAPAAAPLARALAAAAAVRGPRGRGCHHRRGVHLRGARARARALGRVPAPRGLPQARARARARGAAAGREQRGRARRRRDTRRAGRGLRAHAAAAGGVGGRRVGPARDGAGRACGQVRGAVVEADRGGAGRGRVRRPRGREARRRAAVARAEDGRVRRRARGRRAVRRRVAPRQPRARRRAHAPGRAAPAGCVPVQARQLGGVRAGGGQGGRGGAADGDAAVVAAAALPRQQRDGRAGAERQGEGGDGDGAGGADREAAVGAAGGGPGAVAAPLRRLPGHRLAQPRALLHAMVRRVAQAPRVTSSRSTYLSEHFWLMLKCVPLDRATY